jgi:hypothetical protein
MILTACAERQRAVASEPWRRGARQMTGIAANVGMCRA